jgi:hypothetical protein
MKPWFLKRENSFYKQNDFQFTHNLKWQSLEMEQGSKVLDDPSTGIEVFALPA